MKNCFEYHKSTNCPSIDEELLKINYDEKPLNIYVTYSQVTMEKNVQLLQRIMRRLKKFAFDEALHRFQRIIEVMLDIII